MTLKLTLFSQEVEDFVLELKLDADATFFELHRLIQEACHYADGHNHSFLICDEEWRIQQRIRQTDTGDTAIDEDLFLMDDTPVSDFLEEEGQHLAYVFDPEEQRYFLMELSENLFGQPQPNPIVSRRHGKAPAQYLTDESEITKPEKSEETDNTEFYGDEDFDEGEIDLEGFEISEQ
ncbi:MAG: plasmid pRiA4b ORF-3 family protein [Bacteroidaceae bacterium]|nr:plasmid pRiA4b ORF-3 family protein [Bacteroidaceae bacterium]